MTAQIQKVGHWKKNCFGTPFCFNSFCQICSNSLPYRFFSLPLFSFRTAWEVFLSQRVGFVIVTLIIFRDQTYLLLLHSKLIGPTADGEVRVRILSIDSVFFSLSFFLSSFFLPLTFNILWRDAETAERSDGQRAVRFTRFLDYRLSEASARVTSDKRHDPKSSHRA